MTFRTRNLFLGLLAVSAALAGGVPMLARADVAIAEADESALQEITVTARRRNESIQDTPISVTALNAGILEAKGTVNIGDLQGAVPNVLITQQSSGAAAANISIRGLTFADIEKSFDPTVAVVVDGVFLGTSTGSYLDFFDIADFEVLRGPQGTLFGRNTIGGVINVTRSKPTGEFGGRLELSYGNYDTKTGRAIFNAPLIKDLLAAKLFYFQTKTEGYYRDAITGSNTGGSQNQNFGASFLLTPGDGFDALLTVERQIQYYDPPTSTITNSSELFGTIANGAGLANEVNRNTSTDLYTVFRNPTAPQASGNYNAPAVTLNMNWDLGGVKLTSVTGYRSEHENQVQNFDGTSIGLYIAHRIQSFHQLSQEFRAAGKITDTLDYVAGAYFYKGDYGLEQLTGGAAGFPADGQNVSGGARSIAGFGDFDWAFYDKWRLSFGGRYTQDKKNINNTAPDPATGVETFFGAPSETFTKFTPKVGIDYRPNSDLMYYASYSVGYRSGGFSNRAGDFITTNTAFQPETVDSSEVGVKSEWFDRRMSVNASYFFAKYKNMQQNTTIPGGATGNETVVSNVGSSTIKGLELEIVGRVTSELTLNASLGTLSSNFNGFVVNQVLPGQTVSSRVDYSNNNLIYNPSITFSSSADYKVPTSFGDVHGTAGYRHIASYDQQISLGAIPPAYVANYTSPGNDPRVRAAPQDLVDASLTADFTIRSAKAYVRLYGRNLTDDRGPASAFTVAGLFSFATAREPRTYGVTLGVEF